MTKLKSLSILLTALLFSCTGNTSYIFPKGDLKYIESYECWPFDVKMYSVSNIKIDSLFFSYPHRNYYEEDSKHKITPWTKYENIDTNEWRGNMRNLEQCDNLELYNQLLKRNDLYYTGIYRYFIIENGTKIRAYKKMLFLDLINNRLHVFQDVNMGY